MKRACTFILILFSFPLKAEKIIDVISIEYPPYVGKSLPGYGYTFVLLKKYAQKHFKLPYQPSFFPPARAQLILAQQPWCLSIYPPRKSENTVKFITLSKDIIHLGLFRLKQKVPFSYNELSDLQGKTVAVLRERTHGGIFAKMKQAKMKLVYVESNVQGLSLVMHKRVDYAFSDYGVLAETKIGKQYAEQLQFSEKPILSVNIGFYYHLSCESELFKQPPE